MLAAACGDEPADVTSAAPTTTVEPTEYEATGTVLESPEHGPQLCFGLEDSLPPQCEGQELVGWDWAQVAGEESASGTTWGDFHVVGTWDGERLTVTRPPGPPQWGEAPPSPFVPACEEPTGDPAVGVEASEDLGLGDLPDLVRTYVTDDPFTLNVLVRPGAAEATTAAVRERWAGLLCVEEREAPTQAELEAVYDEVLALPEDSPLGEQLSSGIYALDSYVNVQVLVVTEEAQAFVEERWGDLVQLNGTLQPVTD